MKLRLSPLAEHDIENIGDYIAQDNPLRTVSFVEELYQQCLSINESPNIYRERPELGEKIRACSYGRYLIVYSIHDVEVRVERVLHSSRDISMLFPPEANSQ